MQKINIFKLFLTSTIAALGPLCGLGVYLFTDWHVLWGVAFGVFSSSLLVQLLGFKKGGNDGTSAIVGGEGSSGSGSDGGSIDTGTSGGGSA